MIVSLCHPPGCSKRYYRFKGEEIVQACLLPCAIAGLEGICSFNSLIKIDVVFLYSEAEDLEVTARTIVEAVLWMDWWTFSAKSLALSDF